MGESEDICGTGPHIISRKMHTIFLSFDVVREHYTDGNIQLTPFVAMRVQKRRDDFKHTETRSPMDGKEYLRKWKEEGGNM